VAATHRKRRRQLFALIAVTPLALILRFSPQAAAATQVSATAVKAPTAPRANQAPPSRPADEATMARASGSVHATIHWLDYNGHYALTVENMSALGRVNAFRFVLPPGLILTGLSNVQGGSCQPTDSNAAIECTGPLNPPRCSGGTCSPSSQTVTLEFTAQLDPSVKGAAFTNLFWGSYLSITDMTIYCSRVASSSCL
jgi:hypothetical protein